MNTALIKKTSILITFLLFSQFCFADSTRLIKYECRDVRAVAASETNIRCFLFARNFEGTDIALIFPAEFGDLSRSYLGMELATAASEKVQAVIDLDYAEKISNPGVLKYFKKEFGEGYDYYTYGDLSYGSFSDLINITSRN